MLSDRIVLVCVWLAAAVLVACTIPWERKREAMVVFMFKQLITWLLGLLVVQYGLIEYPVREFAKATATSFAFEYFIYPSVCVVFVLRYPKHKSAIWKWGWYLFFPTWMTALEMVIEKYTDLVHYIHWSGYWTWITLLVTFFMSHTFYRWFYSNQN